MPAWLRVALVAFHLAALVAGIWLGIVSYDTWSDADDPPPAAPG